jgi:hypothetical protein
VEFDSHETSPHKHIATETAYDFEKAVRSELGRWMSALRSALHFEARQKESPGG